jgi:transposase
MAADPASTTPRLEPLPERLAASLDPETLAWMQRVVARLESVEAENVRLRSENETLRDEVRELKARLGQNSTNSSRPPSSDPPGTSYKPAKRRHAGKKRGGQAGHKGVTREMLPPERVSEVVDHRPSSCSACSADLSHAPLAGSPIPRQVIELPEIAPEVVEHLLHAVKCENCGVITRAEPPPEATWCEGPRLTAFAALLCGRFRVSREETSQLLEGLLHVSFSKATVQACCERVSAAIADPVDGLIHALRGSPMVHMDETGWKLAGARRWLWVCVATTFTVFAIHLRRGRAQIIDWLGTTYEGIVHSDRWSAYKLFSPDHRQLCWAHLLRDLQAIVDASGTGREAAEETLKQTDSLFSEWHAFKRGEFDRVELLRRTSDFVAAFRSFCESGVAQDADRRWRALGHDLIALWPAVFQFLHIDGVEPTNNIAEQQVRQGVLWRRTSQGCRSEPGALFVSRILTTTSTCRRQDRSPLAFLTAAVFAYLHGRPAPSLLRPDTS